jgi:hypothetical protein
LHCLNESSEAHRQPGVGVGISVVSFVSFVSVVGEVAIMQPQIAMGVPYSESP